MTCPRCGDDQLVTPLCAHRNRRGCWTVARRCGQCAHLWVSCDDPSCTNHRELVNA